jgi:hypothetical protein
MRMQNDRIGGEINLWLAKTANELGKSGYDLIALLYPAYRLGAMSFPDAVGKSVSTNQTADLPFTGE